MLETGIGQGQLVAMATLPSVRYSCDISESSRCWEEDVVEPPWTVKRDRTMRMPEKPGIGVEVVEERLRKCVKNRIEFKKTA